MGKINWIRVLLGGFIAGVVWHLLSAAMLTIMGGDFLAAIEGVRQQGAVNGAVFYSLDIAMGLWAVWLYAAIRPRFGPGIRTAVLTGIAWWLIKSLQSAKWVAVGFISPRVIVAPLVVTLFAIIVATLAGTWPYEE
jgi:hypothetical protein